MSVIVSKRGKQKFGVITKALELAAYTVKICANEKNFPKRAYGGYNAKYVERMRDYFKELYGIDPYTLKEVAA